MRRLLFLLFVVGCVKGECPGEELSLAPHPYKKLENLTACEEPFHGPNCTCPSIMFECACHKFGACGDKPGCIEMWRVNNRENDCGDWSDEFNDICPNYRFRCDCFNTTCKGKYGCMSAYKWCNGQIDCLDASDEVNCTCPGDKFECPCYKTKNCTFMYGCIPAFLQCDGINNCGNWEDESNCTCLSDKFLCACHKTNNCTVNQHCIRKDMQCNRNNDCGDWSDEVNSTCQADKFECLCHKTNNCSSYYGCISNYLQCNGYNDCGDWSDEVNCTCQADMIECPCYKTNNCSKFNCIYTDFQCDGVNDCGDWSDEVNCTCPADQFECECYKTKNCTFKGCIGKDLQYSGTNDCGDWSDEVNCTCPPDQFQCACVDTKKCIGTEISCVDRSLMCNGIPDCFDSSDETHYTCNCSGVYARCPCDPGNKHCPSTGRCIPDDWLGDSVEDCSDKSDELCLVSNFTCQSCTMFTTTCNSEQTARYLVHSTVPAKCSTAIKPSCASDVNECTVKKVICVSALCEKPENFCLDIFVCQNQQVASAADFCDSVKSCSDNSDEIKQGFGFKCSGSSRQDLCVLPQANVYDSVAQCSDDSDLCFVNGEFRCFQCLDKQLIISPMQVCDSVVDCFDMSDECLCPSRNFCDEIRDPCPPNQTQCYDTSACFVPRKSLSNSSVHTSGQYHRLSPNCDDLELDEMLQCAGIEHIDNRYWRQYFLRRGGDAKDLLSIRCDGKILDKVGFAGELYCANMFYCFSKGEINIKSNQLCDGKIDCDDGADEFAQVCYETRYYCNNKKKISIGRKTVCDGIIDCDNESDESRCRCENRRFYCTNKQPLSVEWKLVQNGIQDCTDGSDECVNLVKDPFADVNEMIANPVYQAIFWITSVFALGGNLFVLIATIYSLWNVDRNQYVFINTSVFILNLSLSDLLMGIYLLAVVMQGTKFSGSYCLFDEEWRSSNLCSGLGALAVVSSEASAFTMTAMTTFRLVSAFKPFVIRTVGVVRIVIAEIFCWILSITLATIPLLQATSSYFTTDVWFSNNFFGTDFVSRENMSLLAGRITNAKPESWVHVKQIIREAFPRNPIRGEFGYYGETSVCMPRLFATKDEFAWEYSTFLITINFLLFIYMVVAYVLIYKQSNRMKGSRSTDVSSKMQKRISRLIVSDFCCWIPICIMGYLSVAGIKMPPDAYVLSACLLLPINSALNPLLYSKVIEDKLSKAKKWLVTKLSVLLDSLNRSSDLAVRFNDAAEEEGDRVIEMIE